jgi:hypothetical protein
MTKLLLIENPKNLNGVVWWRCLQPMSYLRKEGFDIEFATQVSTSDIMMADAVIMYRPDAQVSWQIINICKQLDKPVIIDIDDDLVNLDESHPLRGHFSMSRAGYFQCVDAADALWCSTPTLLSDQGHRNAHLIPNAICPTKLPANHNWKHHKTVLWRGAYSGMGDVNPHGDFYEAAKEQGYEFKFWGYLPTFAATDTYLPWQADTQQFMEMVKKAAPGYIWKPLHPCKFNDAKSNIALIEATMAGALCISNYVGRLPWWDGAVNGFAREQEEYWFYFEQAKANIEKNFNIHDVTKARAASIRQLI